jgi:hypothetical protein
MVGGASLKSTSTAATAASSHMVMIGENFGILKRSEKHASDMRGYGLDAAGKL